jgi:hypothetical protein
MTATNTQADGSGTTAWLHGNANGEIITAWHPETEAEETANDSDKSFTVPANEEWELTGVWVEYTSTAVVGDRQVTVEIQDSSNDVIMQIQAGAVQAASLTRYYQFGKGLANLTAFTGDNGDFLMTPLPHMPLLAGWIVRVYDLQARDAAADDMICQIIRNMRSVP